jgi:hypothetical protein
MGGELENNAVFPDGVVSIDQFHKFSDSVFNKEHV